MWENLFVLSIRCDRVSLPLAYKRTNNIKPKSLQNVENSSSSVMIWLWPDMAVFMCGILASCVTGAARKLTGGDYAGAAKSSGGSYAEMTVENH